MTKADIISSITEKTGIDKQIAMAVVESFMTEVKNSLSAKQPVYLRGFGSFVLKHRAAKTARNITLNTTIVVPPHEIPAFKPAKEFVSSVSKIDCK